MDEPKKTPESIRRAHEAILKEIEQARKEHGNKEGRVFAAVTPEQLEEKLNRTNSPIITWSTWNLTATVGNIIYYDMTVNNPDPTWWNYLAVTVFVGARNPITDHNLFLNNHDARFPTLAQPLGLGLQLAPGESKTFSFALTIPAGVAQTGYFGNAVLFQMNFHDVGRYLDRSVFCFGVV